MQRHGTPGLTPCASPLLFAPLNSVTPFHLLVVRPSTADPGHKSTGSLQGEISSTLIFSHSPLLLVYTFFYTSPLPSMSSFVVLMPCGAAVVDCYAAFRCGLRPAWEVFEPAATSRLWLRLASKHRPDNGNCHLLCSALLLLLLPLLLPSATSS